MYVFEHLSFTKFIDRTQVLPNQSGIYKNPGFLLFPNFLLLLCYHIAIVRQDSCQNAVKEWPENLLDAANFVKRVRDKKKKSWGRRRIGRRQGIG